MRLLEGGAWWNAGMRDVAEAMLGKVNVPERGLLLDVGCGSGQTMAWFTRNHPAWEASGIDISQDAVAAAHASGLAVATASATELPFDNSSVDMVITFDVLQHLPLPDGDLRAMSEMRRVLRPGGHLLIRTNCQSYPRTADDPANDFRKYEPDVLSASLDKAGFDVLLLSRANTVLGLAEIPRELRATKKEGSGYHGILAVAPKAGGVANSIKRGVLRAEASLIASGAKLPFGRSILALCRKPSQSTSAG